MIRVSIIVPIYNVEKFLEKCLDSIRNQTLKEIEVICINDGSTDGSLDIVKQFAFKDDRFKVVDKLNAGYGHTMNLGLEHALGEYIGIVESDDFATLDMFEELYQKATADNLDVVKGDYYLYWSSPERAIPSKSLQGQEATPLNIAPSIWSAIYKREFLRENNIRFLETPGASFQDTSFSYKVWSRAKRTGFVYKELIYYRQDNMNSSVKSDGKILNICEEFDEIERYLGPHKDEAFMRKKLLSYLWNFQRMGKIGRGEFFPKLQAESTKALTDYEILRLDLPLRHTFMVWTIAKTPLVFRGLVYLFRR